MFFVRFVLVNKTKKIKSSLRIHSPNFEVSAVTIGLGPFQRPDPSDQRDPQPDCHIDFSRNGLELERLSTDSSFTEHDSELNLSDSIKDPNDDSEELISERPFVGGVLEQPHPLNDRLVSISEDLND